PPNISYISFIYLLCYISYTHYVSSLFFFTAPAPTEIYTLSLHDALPICKNWPGSRPPAPALPHCNGPARGHRWRSGWTLRLPARSEEHTSELQSHLNLVCRLLLEKKKKKPPTKRIHEHEYDLQPVTYCQP